MSVKWEYPTFSLIDLQTLFKLFCGDPATCYFAVADLLNSFDQNLIAQHMSYIAFFKLLVKLLRRKFRGSSLGFSHYYLPALGLVPGTYLRIFIFHLI